MIQNHELQKDDSGDDLAWAFWSQRMTTYHKLASNYMTITHDHERYALPVAHDNARRWFDFERRVTPGKRNR